MRRNSSRPNDTESALLPALVVVVEDVSFHHSYFSTRPNVLLRGSGVITSIARINPPIE